MTLTPKDALTVNPAVLSGTQEIWLIAANGVVRTVAMRAPPKPSPSNMSVLIPRKQPNLVIPAQAGIYYPQRRASFATAAHLDSRLRGNEDGGGCPKGINAGARMM